MPNQHTARRQREAQQAQQARAATEAPDASGIGSTHAPQTVPDLSEFCTPVTSYRSATGEEFGSHYEAVESSVQSGVYDAVVAALTPIREIDLSDVEFVASLLAESSDSWLLIADALTRARNLLIAAETLKK